MRNIAGCRKASLWNGVDIEFVMALYKTGHYTLKQLGYIQNVSSATIYYALKKAGCVFIRTQRKDSSPDVFKNRSLAKKGKKLSQEHRQAISLAKRHNYNGLNGYGHTKIGNDGYVKAYAPQHPHANKEGYVKLHRIIIENKIGRYLNENEVVHHINHDRQDNRIENLKLMDKKEHMRMHMKERYAK